MTDTPDNTPNAPDTPDTPDTPDNTPDTPNKPQWITNCSICNDGLFDEIQARMQTGMKVTEACRSLAEQAKQAFPEMAEDFSAGRIRSRFNYYKGAGEKQKEQKKQKSRKPTDSTSSGGSTSSGSGQ